jgi:hypothetical protein
MMASRPAISMPLLWRLRRDHEQGQLSEPAVQCGAGLEHHGHHENNHRVTAAVETILDEDLTRISPLMYQHVIPNGTYHFARSKPGD